jgi:hypothetical protein
MVGFAQQFAVAVVSVSASELLCSNTEELLVATFALTLVAAVVFRILTTKSDYVPKSITRSVFVIAALRSL